MAQSDFLKGIGAIASTASSLNKTEALEQAKQDKLYKLTGTSFDDADSSDTIRMQGIDAPEIFHDITPTGDANNERSKVYQQYAAMHGLSLEDAVKEVDTQATYYKQAKDRGIDLGQVLEQYRAQGIDITDPTSSANQYLKGLGVDPATVNKPSSYDIYRLGDRAAEWAGKDAIINKDTGIGAAENFKTGEKGYFERDLALSPEYNKRALDSGMVLPGSTDKETYAAQIEQMKAAQAKNIGLYDTEIGRQIMDSIHSTSYATKKDSKREWLKEAAKEDGMFGETIDTIQSSLVQQYGKTMKAASKILDSGLEGLGLSEDTRKTILGDGKSGLFGGASYEELATQKFADDFTGVMVKTRQEQSEAMTAAEKAIGKGDYFGAAGNVFKVLPYMLGDSAGEMASIFAGYPGIALAVMARVNEDAETYAKSNDGKTPDAQWLLGSTVLNSAALLGEKFIVSSGVGKVLSKASGKGKVAATVQATVGETAQEYYDQVQQMYMTQKEGEQTLGEIATSDKAKLGALSGGIMGGTLSGIGQGAKATYEKATEPKEIDPNDAGYQEQIFASIKTNEDAELAMETFSVNKASTEENIAITQTVMDNLKEVKTKDDVINFVENNPLVSQFMQAVKPLADLYTEINENDNVSTESIEKFTEIVDKIGTTSIEKKTKSVEANTILENALAAKIEAGDFTAAGKGTNVLDNSTNEEAQNIATTINTANTVIEGTVDVLHTLRETPVTEENAEIFEGIKQNILQNSNITDPKTVQAVENSTDFAGLKTVVDGLSTTELYAPELTKKEAGYETKEKSGKIARFVSGFISGITGGNIKFGPQSTYQDARNAVSKRLSSLSDQMLGKLTSDPATVTELVKAFEGIDGFKPVSENDINKLVKAEVQKRMSSRQATKVRPEKSTASDAQITGIGQLLETRAQITEQLKNGQTPEVEIGGKKITTPEAYQEAFLSQLKKELTSVPLDFLGALVEGSESADKLTGGPQRVAKMFSAVMSNDISPEAVTDMKQYVQDIYNERMAEKTPTQMKNRVLGAINKESVESQAEMDSLLRDLEVLKENGHITENRYNIIGDRLKSLDVRSKAAKASSQAQAEAARQEHKDTILNDETIHTSPELKELIKNDALSDAELELIYNTRYLNDNTWQALEDVLGPRLDEVRSAFEAMTEEQQKEIFENSTKEETINVCK